MFWSKNGVVSHNFKLLVDIVDFFLEEENKLDQISKLNSVIFHRFIVVETSSDFIAF